MLSTDKLRNKEVINVKNGASIGFVGDIEINLNEGIIDAIIIQGEKKLFSFMDKKNGDIVIKWSNVKVVGEDVILVEYEDM